MQARLTDTCTHPLKPQLLVQLLSFCLAALEAPVSSLLDGGRGEKMFTASACRLISVRLKHSPFGAASLARSADAAGNAATPGQGPCMGENVLQPAHAD